MTYSPGPWEHAVTTVKRGPLISQDVERFKVVAANGEVVCGGRTALRDDDAALIAVAPEMLAVLRKAYQNHDDSLHGRKPTYHPLKLSGEMRAVLDKVGNL